MTDEQLLEAARLEEGMFISVGGMYRKRTPEEARRAWEEAQAESVLVSRPLYERFHAACQAQGLEEMKVVEDLINRWTANVQQPAAA